MAFADLADLTLRIDVASNNYGVSGSTYYLAKANFDTAGLAELV